MSTEHTTRLRSLLRDWRKRAEVETEVNAAALHLCADALEVEVEKMEATSEVRE